MFKMRYILETLKNVRTLYRPLFAINDKNNTLFCKPEHCHSNNSWRSVPVKRK